MSLELTDRERMFRAREFFWRVMDTQGGTVVSFEVAQRQITKIAESLPPFSKIKDARA